MEMAIILPPGTTTPYRLDYRDITSICDHEDGTCTVFLFTGFLYRLDMSFHAFAAKVQRAIDIEESSDRVNSTTDARARHSAEQARAAASMRAVFAGDRAPKTGALDALMARKRAEAAAKGGK